MASLNSTSLPLLGGKHLVGGFFLSICFARKVGRTDAEHNSRGRCLTVWKRPWVHEACHRSEGQRPRWCLQHNSIWKRLPLCGMFSYIYLFRLQSRQNWRADHQSITWSDWLGAAILTSLFHITSISGPESHWTLMNLRILSYPSSTGLEMRKSSTRWAPSTGRAAFQPGTPSEARFRHQHGRYVLQACREMAKWGKILLNRFFVNYRRF